MPEWIAKYWIQWAFGIVTGALGLAVKRLSAKVKKHEEERQAKAKAQEAEMAAIKEGLLAILHDRLYQACTFYIAQGCIDTEGLKNIEYIYKAYHALGGNGTGTELYKRVKALDLEKEEHG